MGAIHPTEPVLEFCKNGESLNTNSSPARCCVALPGIPPAHTHSPCAARDQLGRCTQSCTFKLVPRTCNEHEWCTCAGKGTHFRSLHLLSPGLCVTLQTLSISKLPHRHTHTPTSTWLGALQLPIRHTVDLTCAGHCARRALVVGLLYLRRQWPMQHMRWMYA